MGASLQVSFFGCRPVAAGRGGRGRERPERPRLPPSSFSLSLYAQPPPPGPKRTFHSFSADSLHGSLGTMAALSPPPLAFHSILPPFGARLPRGRSLPLSTVVGATNCARLFDSCCPPPSLLTKLSSFLYGRLGKDGISTLPSISYYSSPVFPSLFKRRGLPPLLASCLGLVKLPSFPAPLHSIWTIHFFMLCCFLIDWRKTPRCKIFCWNDLQAKCGRLNWSGGNEKPFLRIIFLPI